MCNNYSNDCVMLKKNEVFERFKYFNRAQESGGEQFDHCLKDLKVLRKSCNSSDVESDKLLRDWNTEHKSSRAVFN